MQDAKSTYFAKVFKAANINVRNGKTIPIMLIELPSKSVRNDYFDICRFYTKYSFYFLFNETDTTSHRNVMFSQNPQHVDIKFIDDWAKWIGYAVLLSKDNELFRQQLKTIPLTKADISNPTDRDFYKLKLGHRITYAPYYYFMEDQSFIENFDQVTDFFRSQFVRDMTFSCV